MKALEYLSYVGKLAGFVSALNVIPFVDPAVGVLVFAAASLLKDTVNRIGDLLDDGLPNHSYHPPNSSRCKSSNEIASTSGLRR